MPFTPVRQKAQMPRETPLRRRFKRNIANGWRVLLQPHEAKAVYDYITDLEAMLRSRGVRILELEREISDANWREYEKRRVAEGRSM